MNPQEFIERKFRELEQKIAAVDRTGRNKEMLDAQIKLHSAIYDKASAYTNLVIIAGYAGYFGLWSLTKPYLSARMALIAGLLMGISMVCFVFFEIAKMTIASTISQRASRALLDRGDGPMPEDVNGKLKILEATYARLYLWLARFWRPTLILTLAFGLGGIVTLVLALVCGIISPNSV